MSARRVAVLGTILFCCLFGLTAQTARWQWKHAYSLAVRACRQRLSYHPTQGWSRADFTDRRGLPLTNRTRDAAATLATAEGGLQPASRYGPRPLAVHLLGYVNPGDGRGAAGLEAAWDPLLARDTGLRIASILDGRGERLAGLGLRLVQPPGQEPRAVRLTIDRAIQERVEEVADQLLARGAIVVMEPRTGEILAMASRPDFDPDHPERYLDAEHSPFVNRAIRAYQPGSVFKLVVLAAALAEDPAAFWRHYDDPGHIDLGTLRFRCPGEGHGSLTLADALAVSCNTTFIRLALELGPARIMAMAERLGLGTPALEDLPGEDPGEIPSGRAQSPGDTANAAIGQKLVYATPVQLARLVSAIANGGVLPPVRVVMGWEDARGRLAAGCLASEPVRVLDPETARLLRAMMAGAVRYGTGRPAAIPQGAGGKTGTAQTGGRDAQGRQQYHAWFAGFAPASAPRYVAVVFVEEGSSGSQEAAPIFAAVMREVFACE